MILRFRGRDGQFRLETDPDDDFASLQSGILDNLPKNVDVSSLKISNKPHGGDSRRLADLQGVSFRRVGLSYVYMNICS
jgi:nuclear protein localization protein 4 homolog